MNFDVSKIKTVEEGKTILFLIKLELNTYFKPIDFDLIFQIKKRIEELKNTP